MILLGQQLCLLQTAFFAFDIHTRSHFNINTRAADKDSPLTIQYMILFPKPPRHVHQRCHAQWYQPQLHPLAGLLVGPS